MKLALSIQVVARNVIPVSDWENLAVGVRVVELLNVLLVPVSIIRLSAMRSDVVEATQVIVEVEGVGVVVHVAINSDSASIDGPATSALGRVLIPSDSNGLSVVGVSGLHTSWLAWHGTSLELEAFRLLTEADSVFSLAANTVSLTIDQVGKGHSS